MILLNGKSLATKNWFRPESMSLSLEERSSSASMTVGPSAPALKVGDWLLDDCEPGKGIVWRIRTIDEDIQAETRTLTLEHIIHTLKDTVMFGEVTAADMAGKTSATTVTGKKAAQYILNYQSDWKLGKFSYPVSMAYCFNGDTLYDALETITETCGDAQWTFDLTQYPFVLNIVQQESMPSCEMRPGRNMTSIKRTIDRSGMYTRLYPIGENDLHITGDYVQKNTGTYGVICKTETESSISDEAFLRAWAQARLERHCEPVVTITVSGLELSASTGVDLDHLRVGRVCRCPLPEYSTQISERITKMSWREKLGDPETVTVTLSNNREDLSMKLYKAESSSSKSGRSSAKTNADFSRRIEDETGNLYTQISQTATEIRTEVGNVEEGLTTTITQTAKEIRQEAEDQKTGLESTISQTASAIRSEVKSKTDGLSSSISQLKDRVSIVVDDKKNLKVAKIVAAINSNGDSEVYIKADKIKLDGSTSVKSLLTGKATIKQMMVGTITATDVRTAMGSANLLGKSLNDAFIDAVVSGNTVTLKRANGKNSVTFSKSSGVEIGSLRLNGAGQSSFSAELLEAGSSTTILKSIYGYMGIVLNGRASTAAVYTTNNGGTLSGIVASVSAQSVYDAGYQVTKAQISMTVPSRQGSGADRGQRTYIGAISKSALYAPGYLFFDISCHGTTKPCYITVNT